MQQTSYAAVGAHHSPNTSRSTPLTSPTVDWALIAAREYGIRFLLLLGQDLSQFGFVFQLGILKRLLRLSVGHVPSFPPAVYRVYSQ